jgi:hypothetical protein
VPQIVEPNPRQICVLEDGAEVSLRDVVCVQRSAVRLAEDKAVFLVLGPKETAVLVLPITQRPQFLDENGDSGTGRRLRCVFGALKIGCPARR